MSSIVLTAIFCSIGLASGIAQSGTEYPMFDRSDWLNVESEAHTVLKNHTTDLLAENINIGCGDNVSTFGSYDEIKEQLSQNDKGSHLKQELITLKLNIAFGKLKNPSISLGHFNYMDSSNKLNGFKINDVIFIADQVIGECMPFNSEEIRIAVQRINQKIDNVQNNTFISASTEN